MVKENASLAICLDLRECNGLGDLICATPTIKKLSDSYGKKITVLSYLPEIFKKNPFVEKSYKWSSVDYNFFQKNYLMHNSFYNMGRKNESGVEYKHNIIDIRQIHAINLGFTLSKDELDCYFRPIDSRKQNIPFKKYVVIHPVQSWATRTWDLENWVELIKKLNENNIAVIAVGKDSHEDGFFKIQKDVFDLEIKLGINLMNKTSISDCWHIIENSIAFVTMDSGLLHLAGTTDAEIIHLGSHIKPEFRIPYRFSSQEYKYHYVHGNCKLFCGSDMKYGVQEWGNIQGIPPLIKCLENKPTFECHPKVNDVLIEINKICENY